MNSEHTHIQNSYTFHQRNYVINFDIEPTTLLEQLFSRDQTEISIPCNVSIKTCGVFGISSPAHRPTANTYVYIMHTIDGDGSWERAQQVEMNSETVAFITEIDVSSSNIHLL